jgi:hypothetical protein
MNSTQILFADQAPLGRGVGCRVWGVGEKQPQQPKGYKPRLL